MNLKKTLRGLKNDEVILLVEELSKLCKENKEFIELKLNNDSDKSLEYYKNKIRLAFCEDKLSLKNARQAINDFKKLSKDEVYLIELMVYYVECATNFESEHGDLWEAFYTAIENMFESCIKILNDNVGLIPVYQDRLEKIISESCEGWGHRDVLEERFGELDGE